MTTNNTYQDTSLSELTLKLRKEDQTYAKLSKGLVVVYAILIPMYLGITVIHIIEDSPLNEIIGCVCFLLAMVVFMLLFRNYKKEYGSVDYSLPTLQMLKKAANRYRPFQRKTWWALVAVVLIDIGVGLGTFSGGNSTVLMQIVFLGIMIISAGAGLIIWKIRYKPLRDDALKLIKEIEA